MDFKNTPGVFRRPEARVLLWSDAIFVYATTWAGFISTLETLFENLSHYKVRLNAAKSCFMPKEATRCGRTITCQGWRFAEEHYSHIIETSSPTALGETVPNSSKIKVTI